MTVIDGGGWLDAGPFTDPGWGGAGSDPADWELSLDGYLFGGDHPVQVSRFAPWAGLDWRTGDANLPNAHGAIPGGDWLGVRRVPLELFTTGQTPAAGGAEMRDVLGAFRPREDVVELGWQETTGARFVMFGRPRLAEANVDELDQGLATISARFEATDPRIYSAVPGSLLTTFPVGDVGRTYGRTAPRTYGALGSRGVVDPVNAGTVDAPWALTVTGPWDNLTVDHLGGLGRIELDLVVPVGQTLVLDSRDRSVVVDGTASRSASIVAGSRWFHLAPGSNAVRVAGAAGSGTAVLEWRSAWL